jgi:hypothetical protein
MAVCSPDNIQIHVLVQAASIYHFSAGLARVCCHIADTITLLVPPES